MWQSGLKPVLIWDAGIVVVAYPIIPQCLPLPQRFWRDWEGRVKKVEDSETILQFSVTSRQCNSYDTRKCLATSLVLMTISLSL